MKLLKLITHLFDPPSPKMVTNTHVDSERVLVFYRDPEPDAFKVLSGHSDFQLARSLKPGEQIELIDRRGKSVEAPTEIGSLPASVSIRKTGVLAETTI